MIPLRHTLIEMGWPQPQTPIQTENSTAVVFTNKTITKNPQNHQIRNCGGSEIEQNKKNSGTVGQKDVKIKETTALSIILQFIMKQREQNHTWSTFHFLPTLST